MKTLALCLGALLASVHGAGECQAGSAISWMSGRLQRTLDARCSNVGADRDLLAGAMAPSRALCDHASATPREGLAAPTLGPMLPQSPPLWQTHPRADEGAATSASSGRSGAPHPSELPPARARVHLADTIDSNMPGCPQREWVHRLPWDALCGTLKCALAPLPNSSHALEWDGGPPSAMADCCKAAQPTCMGDSHMPLALASYHRRGAFGQAGAVARPSRAWVRGGFARTTATWLDAPWALLLGVLELCNLLAFLLASLQRDRTRMRSGSMAMLLLLHSVVPVVQASLAVPRERAAASEGGDAPDHAMAMSASRDDQFPSVPHGAVAPSSHPAPVRRLQSTTTVSTVAELTAAVADASIDRILLAAGTYAFSDGTVCATYDAPSALCISRDVSLEALEPGTVVLDAQGASSSWQRVMRIDAGRVELIGLNITGGHVGWVSGLAWSCFEPFPTMLPSLSAPLVLYTFPRFEPSSYFPRTPRSTKLPGNDQ